MKTVSKSMAVIGGVLALVLTIAACSNGSAPAEQAGQVAPAEILNVSSDPTRELYDDFNKAFAT